MRCNDDNPEEAFHGSYCNSDRRNIGVLIKHVQKTQVIVKVRDRIEVKVSVPIFTKINNLQSSL